MKENSHQVMHESIQQANVNLPLVYEEALKFHKLRRFVKEFLTNGDQVIK